MTEKKVVNLNHPPKDMSQKDVQEHLGEPTKEADQKFDQSVKDARQRVADGKGAKPPFRGGK